MNPFPGLRPFSENESHFFTGRELISNLVIPKVRVNPLTILFARSGVGKSSFLTCRLIPSLLKESAVIYHNEWGGTVPNRIVLNLLDRLRYLADQSEEVPVLVLDQFEDVFKADGDRSELWECLASCVNVYSPEVHILLSMREEWLGAWDEATDYLPNSFESMIRLSPLTERELKRAIYQPIALEGSVSIEDQLVEEIVKDIRRPNAFGLGGDLVEPGLLQVVCHQLWQAAAITSKRMTLEAYQAVGSADAIIRTFVWNELGKAGVSRDSHFSAFDRVLWVGLTRHLAISQGVKALASTRSLALKLRMEDLGVAGPPVAARLLNRQARKYLATPPEKRDRPPNDLLEWILAVLNKGVSAGFLKKQRHFSTLEADTINTHKYSDVYEFSHDFLSDICQQFVVEFESWLRSRLYMLLGVVFGGFITMPLIVYFSITYGALQTLSTLFLSLLFGAIYFVFVYVFALVYSMIYRWIAFPIIRNLAKGEVPSRKTQPKNF